MSNHLLRSRKKKSADYEFRRIGGQRIFFAEAEKYPVDLSDKQALPTNADMGDQRSYLSF